MVRFKMGFTKKEKSIKQKDGAFSCHPLKQSCDILGNMLENPHMFLLNNYEAAASRF